MDRSAIELVVALAAVVLITVLYTLGSWNGVPSPGSFAGHALGIAGFLLMLATATLYTLRKRLRGFHYGPTSIWLRVHIFTGIVGPFLAVLHTAGKFNGLAGILTLVTVIVVLSGFVGRYLYTATPRTLDDVEVELRELQRRIASMEQQLPAQGEQWAEAVQQLLVAVRLPSGMAAVFLRPYLRWRQRRCIRAALAGLHDSKRVSTAAIEQLLDKYYRLLLQAHALMTARRLVAIWYLLHVPLSGVLFTLALIHICVALYYSTLLR